MDKMLLEFPERLDGERIYLRPYQSGDGPILYQVSQKNQLHLARFESDNALLSIQTLQDAEVLARTLSAEYQARRCFFLGAFSRETEEFVAQIYIGPVDWDLPEFEIGYIADVDHEGQGYVSEAIRVVLTFLFEDLQAHRVRLGCADINERSWRVAEACGFHREGHIRESKRELDGTRCGTYLYGILRREFDAATAVSS